MSRSSAEDFFAVSRTPASTSAGPVELPILYWDVTYVVGLFAVAPSAVAEQLVGTDLEPASLFGDRATVGLAFFEYRGTSVGPYNEVGTAAFVVPRGARQRRFRALDLVAPLSRRALGSYVIDLPVTTEVACATGRELWGYPKFVTEILLRARGRDFSGSVRDPAGGEICELDGRMGPGLPVPPMSLLTYSVRGTTALATSIEVRGATRAHRPGSMILRVGRSRHPMADRLRALGLDGARPKLMLVSERFQSKLYAGVAR